MVMVVVELLQWWYTRGYRHVIRSLGARLRGISLAFSIPLLIRTLFAPWRRVITYGGHSFIDGLKAVLDNTVSRLVGFTMRFLVLLTAGLLVLLVGALGLIAIILWPLLPLLAVGLIVRGLLPW